MRGRLGSSLLIFATQPSLEQGLSDAERRLPVTQAMNLENLKKLRRGLDELLQVGEELATKVSDAIRASER
jgi:hypothetical protein